MKKILLSLFVLFVGVISFCSALDFQYSANNNVSIAKSSTYTSGHKISANSIVCFHTSSSYNSCTWNGLSQKITYNDVFCVFNTGSSVVNLNVSCTNTNSYNPLTLFWTKYNLVSSSCPSCPSCPACPDVDTGSILSGYVPESQLISCQSDLFSCNSSLSSCLESSCPDTELSYSKFYVKHGESSWFQLSGTEFYYVYLPEYLGFNYDYSNNGRDLDFTVGVSTDTGYINNINAIQNSKPSQEDLNKLISEVIPLFVPGLAIILLLYFIFRFIKKVF